MHFFDLRTQTVTVDVPAKSTAELSGKEALPFLNVEFNHELRIPIPSPCVIFSLEVRLVLANACHLASDGCLDG